MKLAAAVIIAGTLLSIGFCMETSRKETAGIDSFSSLCRTGD